MMIGLVGLRRMGLNIVTRLQQGGHQTVVFDVDTTAMAAQLEGIPLPLEVSRW